MNSKRIKRTGLGLLIVSLVGFFFGGDIPLPLMGKFFLGAFAFGTGATLIIVANIIRIKEHESLLDLSVEEEPQEAAVEEDGNAEDE